MKINFSTKKLLPILLFLSALIIAISFPHFSEYASAQTQSTATSASENTILNDIRKWEWYQWVLAPIVAIVGFYLLRALLGIISIMSIVGGVISLVLFILGFGVNPIFGINMLIGGIVGFGIFKILGGDINWEGSPPTQDKRRRFNRFHERCDSHGDFCPGGRYDSKGRPIDSSGYSEDEDT